MSYGQGVGISEPYLDSPSGTFIGAIFQYNPQNSPTQQIQGIGYYVVDFVTYSYPIYAPVNILSYAAPMFKGSGYSSSYNYDNWCALYNVGCPESFNNYNQNGYNYYYYSGYANNACINCTDQSAYTLHSWILDLDGDNYYSAIEMSVSSPGDGWRQAYGFAFDCDDSNPNIKTECYKYYYVDYDEDGYYSERFYRIDDNGGEYTHTTLGYDCDDTNDSININCYTDWYQDNDGDGYHSAILKTFDNPGIGWKIGISKGLDCNDAVFSADNSVCTSPCTNKVAACGTGYVLKNCKCEPVVTVILESNTNSFPTLIRTIDKIKTYVLNNPKLLSIFNQLSGYTTGQTITLLEPNNIIKMIRITNGIPHWGEFNQTTPNVFYIDKYLIMQLELGEYKDPLGNTENLNGTSFFAAMTILHELVHYGRFHNGLSNLHNGDEAGHVFEVSVFNQVLGISGSTQMANNYGWNL
ncbi:MAG: hypothetical protein GZ087_11115 [Flavobacterium sp.]|nr:hypothetical protein [Flavobacterium sp.]